MANKMLVGQLLSKKGLERPSVGCSTNLRSLLGVLLAMVLLAIVGPLRAQPQPEAKKASAADRAAAQALFDEARQLMKGSKYKAACPKLQESMRLDPAIGTQLNLANCFEQIGKTASAWINFIEAAAAAKKADQPKRVKVAKKRAAALKPRLSRMKIIVAIKPEGLEVRRGEDLVGEALYNVWAPVDPGRHEIVASAPGKKPFTTRVKVEENAHEVEVTIEELEDAPLDKPPPETGDSTLLGFGIGTGVVGLAGIAVGSAFGFIAMSKRDESLKQCLIDDPNLCKAGGVALRDEALTAGTISTIGFAVGGAGLVAGVIMLVSATTGGPADGADAAAEQSTQLQVLPLIGAGSESSANGLLLRGTW